MKLDGQSQKSNLEDLLVNLKAIKRYPFLIDLLAAANTLDTDGMIEVIEKALSEPLADPCWICPLEPCETGDIMVLVGTDGRVVHVCSGASSYPFDYGEWWNTSFFDLRRKYMIRVVNPRISPLRRLSKCA